MVSTSSITRPGRPALVTSAAPPPAVPPADRVRPSVIAALRVFGGMIGGPLVVLASGQRAPAQLSHLLMERKMLLEIKRRAEGRT